MPKFNEFQRAAIRAYPNDHFKYLLEIPKPTHVISATVCSSSSSASWTI